MIFTVSFLCSLLLGLWYLQIRNDCTFIKMLACRISPTPLDGAGKKVTLEPGIGEQEAAQFCTLSPSSALQLVLLPEHTEGQPGCNSGLFSPGDTKGMEGTGNDEDHCMVSKFCLLLTELCHGHCTVSSLCFI